MVHNTLIKTKGQQMTILKTVTVLSIAGIIGTIALNAENIKEHRGMFQEQKEMMHHFKGKHQQMKKIMKQLDLTSEQKTELKANRKAMREAMKAKRTEMRGARNMAKFVSVNGIDREAMIKQITQKVTVMANMRADMFDKTLTILTPQQRTKFVALLKADNL